MTCWQLGETLGTLSSKDFCGMLKIRALEFELKAGAHKTGQCTNTLPPLLFYAVLWDFLSIWHSYISTGMKFAISLSLKLTKMAIESSQCKALAKHKKSSENFYSSNCLVNSQARILNAHFHLGTSEPIYNTFQMKQMILGTN